ncbi:MAG: hypothetical protein J7K72_05075 [Candidatus Aenigmarchaeota archaeon]|nr:hypothetical protein [Candidatus Aenigmarchaeota archaeon]
MKAQTQAVTMIMITGVIIALVGAAYMWGKPMIDKRTTLTQFLSATRFMQTLDKKIVEMAGTCTTPGACRETLNLPIGGIIRLDEENNSIIYEFRVPQPMITRDKVLLNTIDNGTVARYGETPAVLSVLGYKPPGSNAYTLRFALRYRELDNDQINKGYKIILQKDGKASGNSKVLITYMGSAVENKGAANKGDLVITKIGVQAM